MKKTPWFPADIKPVHVGVYETRAYNDEFIFFRFWNGSEWGPAAICVSDAYANAFFQGLTQDVKWRGLATKPKG